MGPLKDSGERRQFDSGAVRDKAEGKGRCDLLPACAILRLAKVYEAGAKKYEERNWEKGIKVSSFIDSGIRHVMNYLDGKTDEDHLAMAAWNFMGAMWTEDKKPELQDIPTRKDDTPIEDYRYKIIGFDPGSTVDSAICTLRAYNEAGELVHGVFNGVSLYSDKIDVDKIYKAVTGLTKQEFDSRYDI